MTKDQMLKIIARHGYNVGFGAKKNFATYDLICKAPGWISFISLAVGVFALVTPQLATSKISALLIIFGVITLYIQLYDTEKQKYATAGDAQTKIFNNLELIYRNVKSKTETETETEADVDYDSIQKSVDQLMDQFYDTTISKQIFGSNWYAHYKFFNEFEKRWVEDELELTIRDKVPLSFCLFIVLIIVLAIIIY